ncbi:uncharacterized protein K460DRAFT_411598 [Cucurbitaria berberidis CBS 394.84]|uniref:Uncharacterized protein n=1 Tax=Cucurbitaria berberidis CBS 394.84 TaxID=1168544 RepID=A0A9P4GR27_9PLEO|nr:uncharacterized protein K460DRAFT_411598 [Cucurbitaria berberidis CBS 394.84]KAF1849775.1 hypothetical protein K460DRAFT_411598 [Cucurbitaria berberidis CBS 394.84]
MASDRDKIASLKEQVEQLITRTAKAECLLIATQFYTRSFPREIRDLVYRYVVITDVYMTRIGPNGLYEQPHYHAMDPAFVGEDMAKEIAEVYYSKSNFYFVENTLIPDLIKGDPFDIGIKPFQHIRRLNITFSLRDIPQSKELQILELFEIFSQLLPLLQISRLELLRVQFIVETDFRKPYSIDDECLMLNFLETIRIPMYMLLWQESKVSLRQFDFGSREVPSRWLTCYEEGGHLTTRHETHTFDTNFFQGTDEIVFKTLEELGDFDLARNYVFVDDDGTGDDQTEAEAVAEERLRRLLRTRWGKEHALEFNDPIPPPQPGEPGWYSDDDQSYGYSDHNMDWDTENEEDMIGDGDEDPH